jgi:hypothetical protein
MLLFWGVLNVRKVLSVAYDFKHTKEREREIKIFL